MIYAKLQDTLVDFQGIRFTKFFELSRDRWAPSKCLCPSRQHCSDGKCCYGEFYCL